jgi:hypothetical protein
MPGIAGFAVPGFRGSFVTRLEALSQGRPPSLFGSADQLPPPTRRSDPHGRRTSLRRRSSALRPTGFTPALLGKWGCGQDVGCRSGAFSNSEKARRNPLIERENVGEFSTSDHAKSSDESKRRLAADRLMNTFWPLGVVWWRVRVLRGSPSQRHSSLHVRARRHQRRSGPCG